MQGFDGYEASLWKASGGCGVGWHVWSVIFFISSGLSQISSRICRRLTGYIYVYVMYIYVCIICICCTDFTENCDWKASVVIVVCSMWYVWWI